MPLRLPRVPEFSPPPAIERAITAGELAEDLSEVEIQGWLEPIGNTGFYQSPLEPVDPYDCDRWPDSPFCEGSQPFNTDFIDLVPVFTRNACETCITIAPVLARLSLPPYTICKRSSSPECTPRVPRIDVPEIPTPESLQNPRRSCGEGTYKILVDEKVLQTRIVNTNEIVSAHIPHDAEYGDALSIELDWNNRVQAANFRAQTLVPGSEIAGIIAEYEIQHEVQNNPYLLCRVVLEASDSNEVTTIATYTSPGVYNGGRRTVYDISSNFGDYTAAISEIKYFLNYAALDEILPQCLNDLPNDQPVGAPPYGPPEGYCCMSCCQNDAENTELLRLIAKRLGTDQYPASVPKSLLTDKGSGQQEIESLTQLIGWFVNQVDGLVGQFPVEIEITDSDPTKKGDQKEKVVVPNIAEAIAEMYGLALKNSVDSDVAVSFLMRLASETIATKNAALITQDYARANAQFLGYKGNNVKRKIPYAFNPEGLDSLETILQESSKFIVGWEATNDDTLLDFQQRLMFAAGIIKAVFFRGQNNLEQLKREVTNLVDGPQEEDGDERWREYLRAINNASHRFNTGNVPKPKIKDLQVPEDVTKLPTQDPSQK